MYNVSNKFREAMNSAVISPRLKGKVGKTNFTEADIAQGSFRVCNQCVDVSNLTLGGVYIGELRLTFLPTIATQRGNWVGKRITCEYGLDCGDEVVYIPCPSGAYTINSATWTAEGLEVVAYDDMSKLDKTYSNEQANGTAYDWLKYIATKCGVTLGNTRAEIEKLPNGSEKLGLFSTDGIQTYRDALSYLAATLCGFATCDRSGGIVIRSFDGHNVTSIDETRRFEGGAFSDYVTTYTGVSVVDMQTKEVKYYGQKVDDGLTMKLGSNPFLQLGLTVTVENMRKAILKGLEAFAFVPYSVTLLGCCAYDLGDCITFTGGLAENSIGCVMSYDFGLNDYCVAGYGDNPALQSAESKLDKNITGLINEQKSEALRVTQMTNINSVRLTSSYTQLGQLNFAVTKQQTVLFHAVAKLRLLRGGLVRFKYSLNGTDIDFIHEVNLDASIDTATLFIPAVVEASTPYRFTVSVQSDNAEGLVDPLNLRGAIIGSGVLDVGWNGFIVVGDVYSPVINGYKAVFRADESFTVKVLPVEAIRLAEVLEGVFSSNHTIPAFDDDVRFIIRTDSYEMDTEDNEAIITEDGERLISIGGFLDG